MQFIFLIQRKNIKTTCFKRNLMALGLISFLLLSGCSPSSLEDFQAQGDAACYKLVKELRKIQCREELVAAFPKLKQQFDDLAQLIAAARTFYLHHEDMEPSGWIGRGSDSSEQLLKELRRIYTMEGGREWIEKAQREALFLLDALEPRIKS